MIRISLKKDVIIHSIFVVIYVLIIIFITVFCRERKFLFEAELMPFWSYMEWIKGNNKLGTEIILNIGLFVPYGYILVSGLKDNKRFYCLAIISGFFLSLSIELAQYWFKLGLFEVDDVINNTLGTIVGGITYNVGAKVTKKHSWIVSFIFLFLGILIAIKTVNRKEINNPSLFAIKIETIEESYISGYAFPYNMDAVNLDYDIILRDIASEQKKRLSTQNGIYREDINAYYDDVYDYNNSGFIAEMDELYPVTEILIDWHGIGIKETGIFVVDGKQQCAKDVLFDLETTDLEYLMNDGYLIMQDVNASCSIYQLDDKLYWIVDDNFAFEEDGSTYIEYQLWTTNPQKLSENRKRHGFDNIGFVFEDYEITNTLNCGEYRVAVRDIPSDYPISYIKTGYYLEDRWVWKDNFRLFSN